MRYIILIVFLCICFPGSAVADDAALQKIDIAPLERWADEAGKTDVKDSVAKLIKGEFKADVAGILDEVKIIALGEIRKAVKYLVFISAPCLILSAVRVIYPATNVVYALQLVCSMTVTATLLSVFGECAEVTREFLKGVGTFNESAYPIMSALLTLSGKSAASALFSPTAALAGGLVSSGIAVYAPMFAICAAVLACAGQMSVSISLEGLARLVKRVYNLLLGAAMTGVVCLIAARGEMSKGYDSSSIQTAKFTIGSLIPIVGKEVADSMDAVVLSASLVKNAVGVTGILALAAYCARPVITLMVYSVCLRLASAVAEPLGVNAVQKAGERFADAVDMLLAACTAAAVLMVILLGAAMTLFGG